MLVWAFAETDANTDNDFFTDSLIQPQQQSVANLNVQVYPNPFVNELNIVCEDAVISRIEVWSMKREMMFVLPVEIQAGSLASVNTAIYPQGYYIVKVFFNNLTKTILVSK
jgi:hypothetical protein